MIVLFIGQGILAAFLGSAANDVIVRGFVYGHLKDKLSGGYLIGISTLLYMLEDVWQEGLDPMNFIFSFFLGIALAYMVVKTGSIWCSIGIHSGWNTVHNMIFTSYGEDGKITGVFLSQVSSSGMLYDFISIGVIILLLIVVIVWLRSKNALDVWPHKNERMAP